MPLKLLGNVAFNPISALTGGTLEELVRHPEASQVIRQIMAETEAVAAKLGIELPVSIDQNVDRLNERIFSFQDFAAVGRRP